MVRSFGYPAEDIFLAIVSACNSTGLVIESINSSSQEIIARLRDRTGSFSRVVLSVRQPLPGTTTVSASLTAGSHPSCLVIVERLLSSVDLSLARRGSL